MCYACKGILEFKDFGLVWGGMIKQFSHKRNLSEIFDSLLSKPSNQSSAQTVANIAF